MASVPGGKFTSFHHYASSGNLERLQGEMNKGGSFSINHEDREGHTALHHAARAGQIEVMFLLLSRGASLDHSRVEGSTPLHAAVTYGQLEAAKLLVERGADTNVRNREGRTPLHVACAEGNEEIVAVLLGAGAGVNGTDSWSDTCVSSAAQKGFAKITELLLTHGASTNVEDAFGWSPLHKSALNGHTEVVKLLLRNGADINSTNNAGKTPEEVTKKAEIKELLRLARASPSPSPGIVAQQAPHGMVLSPGTPGTQEEAQSANSAHNTSGRLPGAQNGAAPATSWTITLSPTPNRRLSDPRAQRFQQRNRGRSGGGGGGGSRSTSVSPQPPEVTATSQRDNRAASASEVSTPPPPLMENTPVRQVETQRTQIERLTEQVKDANKKNKALQKELTLLRHQLQQQLNLDRQTFCTTFDIDRVRQMTDNFAQSKLIGNSLHSQTCSGGVFATHALGLNLAVKVFYCASEADAVDIVQNVTLLGRYQHRNLVPIVGSCSSGEVACIIYQNMENGSLQQFFNANANDDDSNNTRGTSDTTTMNGHRISPPPLDATSSVTSLLGSHRRPGWQQILLIAADVCRALVFLHDLRPPFLHGNIKKSNVLLDRNMCARLVDCGLRKSDVVEEMDINFLFRTDMWQFGLLMLELLIGKDFPLPPLGKQPPVEDEVLTNNHRLLEELREACLGDSVRVDDIVLSYLVSAGDGRAEEWPIHILMSVVTLALKCMVSRVTATEVFEELNSACQNMLQASALPDDVIASSVTSSMSLEGRQCIFCHDDVRVMAVVPCGHKCACRSAVCVDGMRKHGKCPLCCVEIEMIIEIYE
eukprot:GFYU01004254.1.p1 GENE.GFYU01004254.1~~GFYU01004254.1.p1  ORF type:complete len:819 (+),score=203.53 GFYU01004254.1:135-2591(+)